MKPFFFGSDDRRLFGIFQGPYRQTGATTAVLLCNPFGQEAVRSHRMFRVLADRLARNDIAVLRFDYFATGDSAGDDADGEPAGWTLDVAAAHEELLRQARPARVVWLGARLGATLAIKASATVLRPPDRLILWETILDGNAYLEEASQRHIETLKTGYNVPEPLRSKLLAVPPEGREREGIGFELGDALRSQLAALTPASVGVPRATHCDIVGSVAHPAWAKLIHRWKDAGIEIDEVPMAQPFDWMAPDALDAALVPGHAIQVLSQLLSRSK